eukprot:422197_1
MSNDESQKTSNGVFSGTLFKRGKINKGWKQRHFVIYKWQQYMEYYTNSENAQQKQDACGTIDLTKISKIQIICNKSDIESMKQLPQFIEPNYSTQSDKKHTFHIFCENRTYILAALNESELFEWLNYLQICVYGEIIAECWLTKQGKLNKNWKRRYFVLNKFHQLKYFDDEKRTKYLGLINCTQISSVTNGKIYSKDLQYTLELNTKSRTWYIAANSERQRLKWLELMKKQSMIMNDEKEDEIKEINANVIHSGYLFEQSSVLKKYKKRWIELHNRTLLSFKISNDIIDRKSCKKYDLTVFKQIKNNNNNNEFEIYETKQKQRFKATTNNDMQQWIFHIKRNQPKIQTKYKLVLLGGAAVGKSGLVIRFVTNNMVGGFDPTIEESYRKSVVLDDIPCLIHILDTGGEEEFSSMQDQWMREGQAFIVVYSITSRTTFDEAIIMREKILRCKEEEEPTIILVGNKCDLEDQRQVQWIEGYLLAKEWGENSYFLEASALDKINHEECFYAAVRFLRNEGWRNDSQHYFKAKTYYPAELKYYGTWNNIMSAIKHELYAKLAHKVQTIVDEEKIQNDDLSPTSVQLVLHNLRKKVKLTEKEVTYFEMLIKRVQVFAPFSKDQIEPFHSKRFLYDPNLKHGGLLYFLGVKGNLNNPYKNPAVSEMVAVESSPLSNVSQPLSSFVGLTSNLCVTEDHPGAFILVNLKGIKIKLDYYSINRSISNTDRWYINDRINPSPTLTNWNLEGSNDGKNWTIMKKHINNCSSGKWSVISNKYFSYYRIIITSVNNYGTWHLAASSIEFYGSAYGSCITDIVQSNVNQPIHQQYKDLTFSVIQDIYDVHRAFIFSNYNFKQFTIEEFNKNISKNMEIPPLIYLKQINFSPDFVIDDDVLHVFKYFFAASLHLNTEIIVIGKRVKCVYDNTSVFKCS